MPRATPLAQDDANSARSTNDPGHRPALVLIRCSPDTPRNRPLAHPHPQPPVLRLVRPDQPRAAAPEVAPKPVRSPAMEQFAQAAERRRSSMRQFTTVATRMAGQAEQLADTLRALRFAGSSA